MNSDHDEKSGPKGSDRGAFPPADWDRYELVRLIGQGAMSKVYLAHDPNQRRDVALKLVRSDDAELVRRLISEARAMARVHHEHICQVYEVGEAKDGAYIAMQYVDGVSLRDFTRPLSLEQKVQVMRDAAEGVQAAHRAGLIHCNLEPSNILLESGTDGHLKPFVVNFGTAHHWSEEGSASQRMFGALHYMSPEQALGEKPDPRTDVYGLGATFYFLLTSQPPLFGEIALGWLAHIVKGEVRPPSARVSGISPGLDSIVLKCLQKDRAARYPSVRDVIRDLDLLEGVDRG